MNNYELLLDESFDKGLTVKEKSLISSDGRIKGRKIAIRKDIETSLEKSCTLAEELGHHYTTSGNIINMSTIRDYKQEQKARFWAYNKMIGLRGLVNAFEHGCQNRYEIAKHLEVTEEFLQDCINCYQNKYGISTTIDNYYIVFIPYLAVGKLFI